jgi:hypothetical protein
VTTCRRVQVHRFVGRFVALGLMLALTLSACASMKADSGEGSPSGTSASTSGIDIDPNTQLMNRCDSQGMVPNLATGDCM